MVKPDFENVRYTANYLLAQQDINTTFIEAIKFRFIGYKIYIGSIQNYANVVCRPISDFTHKSINGCEVIKHNNGWNFILFDDRNLKERINHGILYEIGHIFLEHNADTGTEEIEANFFASLITVPDVALWYLKNNSNINIDAYFIRNYFNVSMESAMKKYSAFKKQKLYIPNCYEKEILSKMQNNLDSIIEQHVSIRETESFSFLC